MKKLFTLCLLAVTMCAVAQSTLPKIAVYVTGNDDINPMLANRLVSTIVSSHKYTAVERSAAFLGELSKEQGYQRSGAVDDDEISRLGKQFGVQFVCVASVTDVWGEKYISSRIISVETGNVVTTASAFGSITDAQQLIMSFNQLSKTLVANMDNSTNNNAKKVAVYVTKTGNRDVDIILGDQLVAGFSKSNKYLAIERTNGFLSQLSKEQEYQASGAVNDEDVARLGKQFGVNYVCVAQTTPYKGTFFISTRLVDVETADIVNTYDAEGKKLNTTQEVVAVSQEIASNLSSYLEHLFIHWNLTSHPEGADLSWRIISNTQEVQNRNFKFLGTTPYNASDTFENLGIKGLTYNNANLVQIEIQCEKVGYYTQRKRFNILSLINEEDASCLFRLVKED